MGTGSSKQVLSDHGALDKVLLPHRTRRWRPSQLFIIYTSSFPLRGMHGTGAKDKQPVSGVHVHHWSLKKVLTAPSASPYVIVTGERGKEGGERAW